MNKGTEDDGECQGLPGARAQWARQVQCPAGQPRLLIAQHKGPEDAKSLATFKSVSCFLHGVGETACFVGKTIAQGESAG